MSEITERKIIIGSNGQAYVDGCPARPDLGEFAPDPLALHCGNCKWWKPRYIHGTPLHHTPAMADSSTLNGIVCCAHPSSAPKELKPTCKEVCEAVIDHGKNHYKPQNPSDACFLCDLVGMAPRALEAEGGGK